MFNKGFKVHNWTFKLLNMLQVRVKYSTQPFINDSSQHNHYIPEGNWQDLSRIDMMENQLHKDTPLLVNIKGNFAYIQ